MSSGMSSRPSVGVGLKLNVACYNSPQNIFVRQKIFVPGGGDVETLGGPGRRERVLRRGGRVGAGGHPHGALQHSVCNTEGHQGTHVQHRYM